MIGMMSETPSWRSTLRSIGVEKRAIDVTERNVGAEGRSVEDQHPVDTAQIINGFKLKPSRQQANGLRRPFHYRSPFIKIIGYGLAGDHVLSLPAFGVTRQDNLSVLGIIIHPVTGAQPILL